VRNPVTIWIVRVGNDLYVRSAYAQRSAWFRAVQVRHGGLVRAGGVEKDVIFMDAEAKLNDENRRRVPQQLPPPRSKLR
jgi:hypothetical protein